MLHWRRLLPLLLAAALIAAACGSDGGDTTGGGADAGTESEEEGETEEIEAGAEAEGDIDTEIAEAEGERTYGGEIIVGLEAEAVGLRPWEDACSSPCINIVDTIYDKLMESDEDGNLQPFLAESIEANEDFTVFTLKLREGITFHDGMALTGQTLVDMFPIQQAGTTSSGRVAASFLENVVLVDEFTVEYQLSGSNAAFPAYLERVPLGHVFQPELAASDPDGYTDNPIGTGPFMIDTRDRDNRTVVVRNPDYWMTDPEGNQLPFLDSIEFRPIPDEGTRLDSLISGTIDVMQTLRQGTIRDARASDDLILYEFQGNNVGGGMYNMLQAPLDDVRVRNALTMMNNQDAVIESLGGTGISLPGTQWFSPDSPWYSEKAAEAWPQFDFEAGQARLQEYIDDPERSDGKAVGENIDVSLSCPPDPTLIAAMQVIEQLWTASGLVNVELTNFDQATHINLALGAEPDFNGEHSAHCWRWSSDQDPSTELNRQFAPYNAELAAEVGLEGIWTPTNYPNVFDAEIFQWLTEAIETDDFETRKGLYEQVMIRIAELTPIWYSGHTATLIATSPGVQGFNGWHLPDGALGFGFPAAEGRYHEVWRTDLG